jgi:hypothetical protein
VGGAKGRRGFVLSSDRSGPGWAGGHRWRLLPTFFALAALGESHHIIKTIVRLDYFPGVVTAIAYVTVGVLLLRAIVREFKGKAVHA